MGMTEILEKINFDSFRSAVESKEELKILEELQTLINELTSIILSPNVEDMENEKILEIVNSQSKVKNIIDDLFALVSDLNNESIGKLDTEKIFLLLNN